MARYWVGDSGERSRTTDPAVSPEDRPTPRRRTTTGRERVTDVLRRTLAGNVTADEVGD